MPKKDPMIKIYRLWTVIELILDFSNFYGRYFRFTEFQQSDYPLLENVLRIFAKPLCTQIA